jgi:hypothetical protein
MKLIYFYFLYFFVSILIVPAALNLLLGGFGWPQMVFMVILAPVLSFFIFKKFLKKNQYIPHAILVFLVPIAIIFLMINSAFSNIQIG